MEEGMEEEFVGAVGSRREVGCDGGVGKFLGFPLQWEVSRCPEH